MTFRIGQGFDVHRMEKDENGVVPICGVIFKQGYQVIAHSDGDVGLHALCDAMLGAMALGDIGDHFPPSDPQWKGRDSLYFVQHIMGLMKQRKMSIVNVDITILAERPRLYEKKILMREILAKVLEIDLTSVSIKATTTEKLGFVGREEGVAAQAVCLLKT
jgi:2-C-methyl-D-erythritol 2,4-cyclodiphosphate synthase